MVRRAALAILRHGIVAVAPDDSILTSRIVTAQGLVPTNPVDSFIGEQSPPVPAMSSFGITLPANWSTGKGVLPARRAGRPREGAPHLPASQIRTVLSPEPENKRLPSGLKTKSCT